MTTTEFHNALLQGKGRCIRAVREDPEAYRDEVLWACSNLVSFDTQCEGSKSWLVYTLVSCYPDRTPFVRAACDALLAAPSDGSWLIHCLAELLSRFMADGDRAAWNALREKYRRTYEILRRDGRPEDRYWSERDDFERLSIHLAFCREAFLDIARDIGRLYVETDHFDGWDFEWFFTERADRCRKALERGAQTDAFLAACLRVQEETREEFAQMLRQRGSSSRLPRRNADPAEIQQAMERYLQAQGPDARAEALDAFWVCPYPGDPAPLLADAHSGHERLRETAWRVLRTVRHPRVRELAIANLGVEDEAFEMFITNYDPRDEERLMAHLRATEIDFDCTTSWHADQLDAMELPKPPRAMLEFIYDTTYCSCCRERAIRLMGKRRMLTIALLTECQYDSNANIRTYARRALNRRKPK